MPRTLTFEQITDSRFGGTLEDLKARDLALINRFNQLSGLIVRSEECRTLLFDNDNGVGGKSNSFRKRYYIQKLNRKTTWNEIYDAINKIKAAYYSFSNMDIIDMEVDTQSLRNKNVSIDVVKSTLAYIKSRGGLILGLSVKNYEHRTAVEISFNNPNGNHQFISVWHDDVNDKRLIKTLRTICRM